MERRKWSSLLYFPLLSSHWELPNCLNRLVPLIFGIHLEQQRLRDHPEGFDTYYYCFLLFILQGIGENEVIIRLNIGDIVGKKVKLSDLPWTPDEDPLEQIPPFRDRLEPNPLPKNNSVTVFTFLGVPYAEPPTGERRFKVSFVSIMKKYVKPLQPPQQLINFPGTNPYLAFRWGAACPQDVENEPKFTFRELYPFDVSEDCLYLNIFTPDVSLFFISIRYSVIVFIDLKLHSKSN